jgi:hypothetical protein
MAKSEAMSANQILRGVHQVLTLEKVCYCSAGALNGPGPVGTIRLMVAGTQARLARIVALRDKRDLHAPPIPQEGPHGEAW